MEIYIKCGCLKYDEDKSLYFAFRIAFSPVWLASRNQETRINNCQRRRWTSAFDSETSCTQLQQVYDWSFRKGEKGTKRCIPSFWKCETSVKYCFTILSCYCLSHQTTKDSNELFSRVICDYSRDRNRSGGC